MSLPVYSAEPRVARVTWVALAAITALLVLCLFAAPAFAKNGQVTVRAAGITNESVTVKLNELGTNDINNREYRLKSGQVTISGHSLRQVMERAGSESEAIDFETIPSITIDRPSGNPITVSGDDMRNPDAFPDGPPVFYEDNGATVFVMPGVTEGSSGNRYRFAQAPVGISVGSGAAYEVELSASRTKAKVGQEVTFTASVTGQGAGENLSFDWNFNDGKSRTTTTRKVSHTFAAKGSFAVILDVSGNSGSGQSGILIEVEADKQKKKDDSAKQPDGNEGTDGQNGGTGGTGTGDGFGTGTGGFGTGTGSGFPGALAGPAVPLAPSAPSPIPVPQPEPEPRQKQPVDDGLVEVTGEVVDSVSVGTPVSPDQSQVPESADPAPSGTEQGGFGIPGEAWALAGVGLLLGLGGFAELRVFSRLY